MECGLVLGNLVGSQDQSNILRQPAWVKRPEVIQIAELVDAKSTGDKYNVEYTIEKRPGPKRHLLSAVILGYNGRYNRLLTVTGQCLEEDWAKYQAVIRASVASVVTDLVPLV